MQHGLEKYKSKGNTVHLLRRMENPYLNLMKVFFLCEPIKYTVHIVSIITCFRFI